MNRIKSLWKNYVTSGSEVEHRITHNLDHIKFINSFSVVGILSTASYGVFNCFTKPILGIIEISLSILGIINVIYLRKSLNFRLAGSVILFIMYGILLTLLITGGLHKTGFLWYYTFPLLAFFLKGRKKGTIYIIFLYVLTLSVVFLHINDVLVTFAYSFLEVRQLLMSLLAVVFLVYFYEKIREEGNRTLRESEKQLLLKSIFDEQIKEAGIIQKTFIPKKKINEFFEIVGFYQPAMVIGGDYLDFFQLRDNSTGIIIGDVSGKGIPGGLIMVKIRTIAKIFSDLKVLKPSKMIDIMNKTLLKEGHDHIFVTLSYLILDHQNKKVKFSNAGHFPLSYYSHKQKKIIEIGEIGYPIGIESKKNQYQDQELKLVKGDIIFLYTDGVTELKNKNKEQYGKDRLFSKIELLKETSAKEISENITSDINNFLDKENQNDDIAFIIIKIK